MTTIDKKELNSVLLTVAREGKADAAKLMLAKGAEINCAGGAMRRTPLLEAGVEPAPKMANGATPLHAAAYFGRAGCVHTLLSGGADPEAKDEGGLTAKCMAWNNSMSDCVKLLNEARQ